MKPHETFFFRRALQENRVCFISYSLCKLVGHKYSKEREECTTCWVNKRTMARLDKAMEDEVMMNYRNVAAP